MSSPEPETGFDRREFYRVKTWLPLRHRAVAPEELAEIEAAIRAPRDESDVNDPGLDAWMRRLEHKLDLVLSHLDDRFPPPLCEHDAVWAQVSASGIRFAVKDLREVGAKELVEFLLPGALPRHVRVVARVVDTTAAEEPDEPSYMALAFDVIDEEDREAIVRFSNEVQRSQLRTRAARRLEP